MLKEQRNNQKQVFKKFVCLMDIYPSIFGVEIGGKIGLEYKFSTKMKSVEDKLAECRQVIIQNVEKSMQSTMVFRYLKEAKIDSEVKNYIVNSRDGFISLDFNKPEQARKYYETANFKDKILIRPFNIYFNLTLSEDEMKKYYFEGLTDDNMRRMFEIARKVGVVKVYTSYTSVTSTGKLKPNGILSFIRKDDISEAEFNGLQAELEPIGVKLSPYKAEKGVKCSVILTNFFEGNIDDDEEKVTEEAKNQADKLIRKATKNPDDILQVTPVVKRRQIPTEDKNGSKTITKVKAIVEFKTSQSAIDNFEAIRIAFLEFGEARATLNFHNYETNSYISLFTSGLVKPNEKTNDKVFEDELVKCFRHVNKNIVQVNVFPAFNKTYVARVYLSTEEAGKDFIVDFPTKREFLVQYFKENNNIRFNINVDDKTMKKIKVMQKRAGHITSAIKNESDNQKKAKRPQNQMPIYGQHPGMLMGMGGMQMPPPNMGGMPPMGMNRNMPPPPGPGGFIPPPLPPNMGGMLPGNKLGNPNFESTILKNIQDRQKLVESARSDPGAEKNIRSSLSGCVRYTLETKLNIPSTEAPFQMNAILKNNEIGDIIDFLANPKENYGKINKH